FLQQVVGDGAMAAAEAREEAGGILAPLQGTRRQLQAGDPAFGAGVQQRALRGRQRQSPLLQQVGAAFLGRELQLGGAQFQQGVSASQARQRQRRVGARREHQVQLGRLVLQQQAERG